MAEQDVEYAGFWIRVGAMLIDTLALMAVTFPLLILVYGWAYFGMSDTGLTRGPADILISWVFPAVAVVLFWLYKQATPGKMILSCKVVDADTGGPLTVGQSIGRYAAYYVSILPFCLGLFWVAFDRRKQGWHDKLAGTVVIRTRHAEPVKFDKAG
jgi:uncharacterized RDD family membrane protein YckC